ncbi:hypothetical protein KAR48_13955 [bacterium]|nr:hypothetical protein [bacterium]
MKYLKLLLIIFFFAHIVPALPQEIVKIVKIYTLINIDQTSGFNPGDILTIIRTKTTGQIEEVGKVKIIRFAQDKCAAKIVSEKRGKHIAVGDRVRLPSNTLNINSIDSDRASTSGELGSIGIEKGDKEISFIGFYIKMVGMDSAPSGIGAIMLSVAYSVTPELQIGFAPQLMIYPGFFGATYKIFGWTGFINYHFSTSSRWIPYVSGQWYQDEFAPGESDMLDHMYLTLGGGLKNFFTEYAALVTSISYGFPVRTSQKQTVFTIRSGVSVFF